MSAPGSKKFLSLMGAPANRVLLFPPNTHDQIAITALAMEKAKSPTSRARARPCDFTPNGDQLGRGILAPYSGVAPSEIGATVT